MITVEVWSRPSIVDQVRRDHSRGVEQSIVDQVRRDHSRGVEQGCGRH